MANRPLLLFPAPELADRGSLPHGFGGSHRPSHVRQGERLSPIFAQLQAAFDARQVELQQTAAGVDPEQVVVIETIGDIKDFANAVRRIEGFEWMGETEIDEIAPDEDFYDEKKPEKELSGRLYLVMTNQQALQELLSLWNRYKNDENMTFEHGLAKFREVFIRLKNIRRWDVQDRLDETGVLDIWREELEHFPEQPVRVEVELWYRSSEMKRQSGENQVTSLIENLGGTILNRCVLGDIAYHSVLAELPRQAAQQMMEHSDVELIKCDSVMFFRPVGQMATDKSPVEGDLTDFEVPENQELPTGEPVVAVLDGLPLANHRMLADRLIIDDPDDLASQYTVADRVHGTAMTSLVVHGDLTNGENPLARPVYVRPIMKPIDWCDSPRPEHIPADILVVDLIYRAVRRMFEGDGTDAATAPEVRIINLSIGDPSRQFTQTISPLARLLDWLSLKYKVLFVISAGNHTDDIETGISANAFNNLDNRSREELGVKKLYENARHRRLLSPAESINGITVGSLHHDESSPNIMDHVVDVLENALPSPVSAFGSGYRRSVKPDLIYDGGRVFYDRPIGTDDNAILKSRHYRSAPGNSVAAPSSQSGELDKAVYCCGTSNSAALISRAMGICHDSLLEIFEEQAPEIEFTTYVAPLLKAMIVHGCSWAEIGERLQQILETADNGRHIRSWISRWLGYGVPDYSKVLDCTEQRVSILGFGELGDGEAHVFSLPLPSSLASRRDRRKLTVTLAYLSPIASSTQLYRTANLWFEIDGVDLASTRQDAEWRSVRRGTVQHEVFENDKAVPFADGDAVSIKVNCRKDARRIEEPVAYGLVVSLEVAEGIDIPIYEEVRTRIATAVEIRAREGR